MTHYLTPLQKPKENCWFKNVPIGRNKLSKAISNMCKECGIQGYKTNHSLRATAASRYTHLELTNSLLWSVLDTEVLKAFAHTNVLQ